MVEVKRVVVGISLMILGLISIGISSWQYQINANGIPVEWSTGHDGNVDDSTSLNHICSNFPYNSLRPFSFTATGYDNPAYCGYPTINTGYRLAIACLIVLFGLFIALDQKNFIEDTVLNWSLFTFSILWYGASGADIISLVQGSQGCDESWGEDTGITCNGSVYGITVAIDLAVSLLLLACWIIHGNTINKPQVASTRMSNVAV